MPTLSVTAVTPGDPLELGDLWDDLDDALTSRSAAVERARSWWMAADPSSVHARVAWVDRQPVGAIVATVVDAGPALGRTLLIVALYVRSEFRQRGYGHALLSEMSSIADGLGIDQVSVDVEPRDRDANRFYARLGFVPLNTRRTTPAAALRRKLSRDIAAEGRRFSIRNKTLARRRAVRGLAP